MGKQAKYQRYTKKTKLEAVRRVLEKDEPVQAVLNDLGIRHRDNIYVWIKKYQMEGASAFDRNIGHPQKEQSSASPDKLIKELSTELDILKKFISMSHYSIEEKYQAIDALQGQYPLDTICKTLEVSEIGFKHYKKCQQLGLGERYSNSDSVYIPVSTCVKLLLR
ncbi:transposase [Virgibacillus litoralis]|uniref:Transposase-like protein n=1 Tax=Virgibacillus litoralis TaxID=578221 RepID=A0ABS4HBB2_9BACI|nr:transposase [Virgibacillus litoralis]MBP1948196.1 transposase-like protein [Virgibacillus litoralis]